MNIKAIILNLFVLFTVSFSSAQEVWSTQKGDLKIHPIRHASLVLEWSNLTIYIDPVGDPISYQGFPAPDVVIITHSHGDHLSLNTLDGIKAEDGLFVVPEEVFEKLTEKHKSKIHVLKNNESTEFLGLEIEAVPAYNYPVTKGAHHLKGVGNGYIFTLNGMRIYVSGDTGNIPEMNDFETIDIAFLCMNLPYTMDVDEAAKATLKNST